MLFTLKGRREVIEKVQKPHFGFNEFGPSKYLYSFNPSTIDHNPFEIARFQHYDAATPAERAGQEKMRQWEVGGVTHRVK